MKTLVMQLMRSTYFPNDVNNLELPKSYTCKCVSTHGFRHVLNRTDYSMNNSSSSSSF